MKLHELKEQIEANKKASTLKAMALTIKENKRREIHLENGGTIENYDRSHYKFFKKGNN